MTPTSATYPDLTEENALLKAQVAQMTSMIDGLQATIHTMQHRMDDLLKRVYGRSSEKLDPGQLLFQDVLLEADKQTAPAQDTTTVTTLVKEHTRHKHGRSPLPEHLPRVEHMQDIADNKKVCACGKPLKHIGTDVTERIDCQPASLFVNAYVRPKYACPDCNCDGCGVKQAPTPEGPIERCEADAGMLAHVIDEKFEHHTPLFRQELKLQRLGVEISRQTMSDWMASCAKALTPLYELMRREILAYDLVLNDDTRVDMRDGPEPGIRTARFWATVGAEGLKYTLYNFTLDRGSGGPEEFFKGYRGYFVSDAYAGYNGLFKPVNLSPPDIINAACWAHARRHFVKAEDSAPHAAMEILTFIAMLYKIEAGIKHDTPEERLAVRRRDAAPIILKKIRPWLESNLATHLPQSPMRQAIGYSLGIWKELNVYLQDGRIPIDNNLAENAIRPIALGRKNWLFVGSETGGHTAATLMSFTATCRKNKINTWEYLKDVLQRIQSHPASRLHELLPDQWQAARQ